MQASAVSFNKKKIQQENHCQACYRCCWNCVRCQPARSWRIRSLVEVLDGVEYRKYLRCQVRTRGTDGSNRRCFWIELLQESATTTQKRAANIYVSADDYTDPAQETLAHLDANTVCHVKFLSQKSTRRCRNLVAALPRR